MTPNNISTGYWGYYDTDLNSKHSYVHTIGSMWHPYKVVWEDHVNHIAHEYGHALGLHHTYDSEYRDINHYDFLNDVFGNCVEPQCSCNSPVDYICYLDYQCFYQSKPEPYPLMSNGGVTRYISPKQSGRMHRALAIHDNNFRINNRFVHKYVKEITPATVPYEITSNEVWDFKIKMYQNIIVKPGNTLTIKCEVMMPNDGKIVVEPGARLIIDGGRVTNFYYLLDEKVDLWQGIEVWGNNQANQSTANQGFLQLKNNAVIENARTAVAVWKRNDYTSSGGIVMASNSTFKNNWRSVEYISYHNFFTTSNNEISNKGLLSNCEFIWDDDYEALAGTDIGPAITLCDIFGLRIQGCDFIDNRSYITKLNDRTVRVFSIDAGYRVIGRRFIGSLLSPQPTEYDETEYDVGQFINMREGIRATNSSSQANVIVDHCKFLNSHIGVNIRGVDNSMVTRNLFSYTADHPNEISSMFQLGIVEATDYMVEGNHFMNDVNGASVLGALVMNTGVEQNVIYKNKYDGVFTGNYAFGKNTNDLSGTFSTSGLQWKCNEYNNFKYDQYVDNSIQVKVMEMEFV